MYQFIHIETYARSASTKKKPDKKQPCKKDRPVVVPKVDAPKGMDTFTQADGSKGKKGKSTMTDVLAEALRDEGHCAHVTSPEPPIFLVGDEAALRALPAEIEQNCEAHKERTGARALRKDAHVLLAGVASYPRALQVQDPSAYDRWEKATVKWLQEKYGDNLRCVLRHDDEAHPHIHFFVCDRTRVNAKELHDGYAAATHLPASKAVSKEATQVFNDAMRDFQSDYYAKVGHGAGLLRDGPKRLRLDGATYNARKREARERVALTIEAERATAAVLNDAAIEAKKAAELRREVERAQQAALVAFGDMQFERQELRHVREGVADEKAEIDEQRQGVQRDRAEVEADWASAREAHAAAALSKTDAARKLSALDKQADAMERARAAAEEAKAEAELATVARDRETGELRTEKARAVAFSKKFAGQLAGLGAVEDVRALVRKPELAAMLEFIDQNPGARKVLGMMKADPDMARYIEQGADALVSMSNGEEPTWEPSQQVSLGAQYLAGLDDDEARANARKARDSGMDFGM